MEKIRQNVYRNITLYGILLTAWLIWAQCGPKISYAVFEFGNFFIEDRVTREATSTDYRFPERFQNTLSRYKDFGKMYCEEYSTAIPGLEYTNFGNSYSNQMIPQGICIAGDYMLITAYDNNQVENSVIYVLSNTDETNREWLTTIILPDKNHVGGIAFDGERIWLAKSTSGYCSTISYRLVELAVLQGGDNFILEDYQQNIYCGVRASFLTYFEDRLWVGTYCDEKQGKGEMSSFRIEKTERGVSLLAEAVFEIPSYAQGISFIKESSHMLLTASCGRYKNSDIYIYEMEINDSYIKMTPKGQYIFPPMAEGLISYGEYTYFLFESAATCYSTSKYQRCIYPVDRVSAVSNLQLLQSF